MSTRDQQLHDTARALPPESFKRYRRVLHQYLLRRLRHRTQDTADLTQEIFERFLRKRDRPSLVRNPLAYLYGIASHVVSETLEQEPQELVLFDSELAEGAADTEVTLQNDDVAREVNIRQDIIWALGKLPAAQRAALLLVERQGLSCKEAARLTGYSANTIKQYLSAARATMQELLEDYWSEERRRR
jgi:RNA polymerase sigma-70 factor (ECF subfamily)